MIIIANAKKMSQTNCLATSPSQAISKLIKENQSIGGNPSNSHLTDAFYSTYADNFDLSLLPQDCDPFAAIIPTTVDLYKFCDTNKSSTIQSASSTHIKAELTWMHQYNSTKPSLVTPAVKIEQTWLPGGDEISPSQQYSRTQYDRLTEANLSPSHQQEYQGHHQLQKVTQTKTPNQLIPPPSYPHFYPTPQSSPSQSEFGFPHTQFSGCYESLSSSQSSLYPLSPCSSLDVNSIKQEIHALPPSPPESNCETPSPRSWSVDIKLEPIEIELEPFHNLKSKLENSSRDSGVKELYKQELKQYEYQQLRENLEDTSYQKKDNLKLLALESFIGDLEKVRGGIEPVISLALEHAKREAHEICAKLQISPDPSAWSPKQVHAWLRLTITQFKLEPVDQLETKFSEDGAALIQLSEEEFECRLPQVGSTLHAQLEVWKLAYTDSYQNNIETQQKELQIDVGGTSMGRLQEEQNGWTGDNFQMNDDGMSDDEDEILPATSSEVEIVDMPDHSATNNKTTTSGTQKRVPGSNRNGGSHIHLWQFLKELLSAPHLNGTAIRWIDRSKGIFKIEDSVRVAKLWGKRKNRPAMNYDKLSRSIRQYYKKGIMKKTERSQRLVYQFCHPYHM